MRRGKRLTEKGRIKNWDPPSPSRLRAWSGWVYISIGHSPAAAFSISQMKDRVQGKGVNYMFTTKGYAAHSAHEPLKPFSFERREPTPTDVQIEILFCGVCHSDLHIARNIVRRSMPRKRRLPHAAEGNYRKGLNRSRTSND